MGGEEADPYCCIGHYDNSTEGAVFCSGHMEAYVRAAAVNDGMGIKEEQIEGLQSGVTIRMDEMNRSCDLRKQLQTEYAGRSPIIRMPLWTMTGLSWPYGMHTAAVSLKLR